MLLMEKTKIFVDCHVFDGSFQGTTTYLKGLYTELIKRSELTFFLASGDTAKLKQIFGEHPNVNYIKYRSHNKFYRLLIDIPQIVRQYKIDYAHFQYIVPPIKFCRYIVTTHDVLFIDFPQYFPALNRVKNTFLYRQSAKAADVLLTVSEYSQQKIRQHFGITNVSITANGVDAEFFTSYNKSQLQNEVRRKFGLENYLIYISRWEPRKNQLLLLKAFVNLKLFEKRHLLFVGDHTINDPAYDAYYNTLESHVREKVVVMKKVDFETMLELLRAADLSVYASSAEGFGIPPLESIAAGVPVITSNATAMADFTFLEKFAFDPSSEAGLEAKLLEVLSDPNTNVADLRQFVYENYSWKNAADSYMAALNSNLRK